MVENISFPNQKCDACLVGFPQGKIIDGTSYVPKCKLTNREQWYIIYTENKERKEENESLC